MEHPWGKMGQCWYEDCCVLEKPQKAHCNVKNIQGKEKIIELAKGNVMVEQLSCCVQNL